MKDYIVILEQGGGCDYTIGCGTKVVHLSAENDADAIKQLVNYEGDEGDIIDYYGDDRLDSCDIYCVSHRIDFKAVRDASKAIQESEEAVAELARKKAERLAQYKELQKEFHEQN